MTAPAEKAPTPSRGPAKKAPNPTKPQSLIIGDYLYRQTEQGELKLPLRMKVGLFEAVLGQDQMVAFLDILKTMGEDGQLDRVREMYLDELTPITEEWFAAVAERAGGTPGESDSSSN